MKGWGPNWEQISYFAIKFECGNILLVINTIDNLRSTF